MENTINALIEGVEGIVTEFGLRNKITLDVWVVKENGNLVLNARVLEAPQSKPFLLETRTWSGAAQPEHFHILFFDFVQGFKLLCRDGATINETRFIISIRCFTHDPEKYPAPGFLETLGNFSRSKTGRVLTFTAIGLGAVAAAVPIGLFAAGFGATGVAAGSFAAGMQASIGNVAAGSFFALCQSMGATGVATAGLWGLTTPVLLVPRAFGGGANSEGDNEAEAERTRVQNEIRNAVQGMSREDLLKILQSDEFPFDEIIIFQAVECWARLQCENQHLEVSGSNIRLVLGREIIDLIRFPTMTVAQFNETVVPTKILTDTEVTQILQCFQLKQKESAKILERIQISFPYLNSKPRWQGIRLFKGSEVQGMSCPTSQQKITFSTSHRMKIESFGFLGPFLKDSEYRVEIQIVTPLDLQNLPPAIVMATQKKIFKVELPTPLNTQPFEEYIIKYKIEGDQVQCPEPLTVIQDCLNPQISYRCVGESDSGILAEISCRMENENV